MAKAMIFAAGLGTRLRPLTDTMPKAMVPVDGVPMIGRLADRLEAEGFDELVVNVHHFPDQIISYMSGRGNVLFSDEREFLLDTGGGLKKAGPLLEGSGAFLVHNVDILSDASLAGLREAFLSRPDALATLLVTSRPSSRQLLFDIDGRLVGWTNLSTGEVRSPYPDLNLPACRQYAFSGIHMISDRIFPLMDSWPERFSIIDFYLSVCATQPIYAYAPAGVRILDLGKPEALTAASTFRLK